MQSSLGGLTWILAMCWPNGSMPITSSTSCAECTGISREQSTRSGSEGKVLHSGGMEMGTEQFGSAWTRKHDNPATPLFTSVPVTAFPASLEDVIELCAGRAPNDRLMAACIPLAPPQAAIRDRTLVQTHPPTPPLQAIGPTLTDVS